MISNDNRRCLLGTYTKYFMHSIYFTLTTTVTAYLLLFPFYRLSNKISYFKNKNQRLSNKQKSYFASLQTFLNFLGHGLSSLLMTTSDPLCGCLGSNFQSWMAMGKSGAPGKPRGSRLEHALSARVKRAALLAAGKDTSASSSSGHLSARRQAHRRP